MALIRLENVSLRYPVYTSHTRGIKTLLYTQLGGKLSTHNRTVMVEAMRNVSLELRDGDRLGIVGHNGAGKTTLLRVLSQIYEPQYGRVTVEGKLSSFVDITLGMDPEATGWDNIRFRCAFLGLTFEQARDLAPSIAGFSELGEYLDLPVRTYSSGMYMRLAFAITTSVYPEIILMDEMIGTGDARFLEKATARLNDILSQTKIFVVASHSNAIITRFCNKVLWMEKGEVKALGPAEEVMRSFEAETASATTSARPE